MQWVNSDESALDHFRYLYLRMHKAWNGDDPDVREDMIQQEAREWYGPTTPDGDLLDDVDWEDVREMMDEGEWYDS